MKFWRALKAVVRAIFETVPMRTVCPRKEQPASPAPVDLIEARIASALKAAGAGTTQEIVAEVRKRHAAFLHANPADAFYAFGMTAGSAHYYASCDLALNAALLAYPMPSITQAMLLKH